MPCHHSITYLSPGTSTSLSPLFWMHINASLFSSFTSVSCGQSTGFCDDFAGMFLRMDRPDAPASPDQFDWVIEFNLNPVYK